VEDCWSDALGYSCCKETCVIVNSNEYGDWGMEDNHLCGIPKKRCENKTTVAQCYGEITGKYKCCESCKVEVTDEFGEWGIEDSEWCSIKFSCYENTV